MIALVGIMVYSQDATERVNAILHDYRNVIAGRMGLPMREKGVNVICVVLETDSAKINALTGKLGATQGVRAKALYGLPADTQTEK
ncbi:MAG: CopG family transcriptional regulator [Clostridia bacterium]|nr:CopG family transcriptional regulator [Clostridia bacterium]